MVFVVGWKDYRACHTIVIPSIQYAIVLVLLQNFVPEQQYGNLGGKPVTAEVVAGEVEMFLLCKLWSTAPTQTGFVNESTDNKNGLRQ